jgi:hypothetical protein
MPGGLVSIGEAGPDDFYGSRTAIFRKRLFRSRQSKNGPFLKR